MPRPSNPEARDALNKRAYAWDKQNTRYIGLKLNRHTDADIIARLESVDGMQGYLKALIRADIAREKGA